MWQAEDAKSRTAESLILRPEIEWAINRSVVGRSDPEFKMLSLLGNPGAGPMSGAVSAGGIRSR